MLDQNLIERLDAIFAPRSIAVVGASDTYEKWGFQVLSAVKDSYASPKHSVYAVNASADTVHSEPCYHNVLDIPGPLDLVLVTVPAAKVAGVLTDCASKGVKGALVITGGFAEHDEGGASLQKNLVAVARAGDISVVGPNIMGHLNGIVGLITTPFVHHVIKGQIGVASQSGNVGVQILQLGYDQGIGFSKFVGTGNEADLTLEDFVEYLGQDRDTEVICLYIEGLKNGRRFLELSYKISGRKPLIVLKAGATPSGANAARSHTSALAGADEIYDAAFRQSGVIRVRDVEQMVYTASALCGQPLPRGNRVGIISIGGGIGVLAADECRRLGLELATLSPGTIAMVNQLLPSLWSHANPIDIIGDSLATGRTVLALLDDPNVDSVLCISTPGLRQTLPKRISYLPAEMQQPTLDRINRGVETALNDLDTILAKSKHKSKPVFFCKANPVEETYNPRFFQKARELGHLIYPAPELAVAVIAHLTGYAAYKRAVT